MNALAIAAGLAMLAPARPVVRFDLTQPVAVRQWQPTHDISAIDATPEGMRIVISGGDPYSVGPARDYPEGQPLWLVVRLRSEQGGMCQVFYFNQAPSEERSVRFAVQPGAWQDVRVPMPPLGPGYRLRLDPPGIGGACTVAYIALEPRTALRPPSWPPPESVRLGASPLRIRSGPLTLEHAADQIGGFVVRVGPRAMATGHTRPLLGYMSNGSERWVDLARDGQTVARRDGRGILVTTTCRDRDRGTWTIRQRFSPAVSTGGIDRGAVSVETTVSVDGPREAVFVPALLLLPGRESYGAHKTQAVFCGVEYLDRDEPSSSEADLVGPASHRQTPDTAKITWPLMALCADRQYVGLTWTMQDDVAALFDSPDRLLGSGAHVMGLLFPGSDGVNREEGSLLPYSGRELGPGHPLVVRATIIGGSGDSVVPAVRQYVAMLRLPPVPVTGLTAQQYVALASGGWLDSSIRDGDLFRHASGFALQPAADVPALMEWLAAQTTDAGVRTRLRQVAAKAVERVDAAAYNTTGIGHVRYPIPALLYGDVPANVARARDAARAALGRFEPDGTITYRPAGQTDYGRTHYERHANGLTAQVVMSILEGGALSGDDELIGQGVTKLRGLARYRNTVPRGAQTWEMPLHTPDILAAAYLVRAYTLGYELTGDGKLLDEARYWAWTGVPLTYLVAPAGKPVGLYATTAVLGATNWVAPIWIGMPVQWCGLVYADALYRLAPHDATGPWRQLADGITASGVQQTCPASDTAIQGLLPDSFQLRAQIRNGPFINPATVQVNAVRLYRLPDLYGFQAFRRHRWYVHAPGKLSATAESDENATFSVQGWRPGPYTILVSGLVQRPYVKVDGAIAPESADAHYEASQGLLLLRVTGNPRIELAQPAGRP